MSFLRSRSFIESQGLRVAVFLTVMLLGVFAAGADDFKSNLQVTISQASYSGKPQIVEQNSQYSALTPGFFVKKNWGGFGETFATFKLEGLAVLPMSDSVDFGGAVPEFYLRGGSALDGFGDHTLSVTVGRRRDVWSELDSHWNLGLWQPLVRWDAASPMEQGLTGVFVDLEEVNVYRLTLMASGLFIPDQQSHYEEKDGKIISANRWFRAPVANVNLGSGSGDLIYDMREPEIKDVIYKESYAASLRLGHETVGWFGRAGFADKPANQFHIAVDLEGILNVGTNEYTAPIYPMVIRHKLYTVESGYKWRHSQLVLSSTLERYENPDVPADWQQTELTDARYNGVLFSQSLAPLGWRRSRLMMSYVRRDEDNDKSKATLIKGEIEASAQRFQFEEIAGLEFLTNVFGGYRRGLDVSGKYVYSLNDSGEWIQAGLKYRHDTAWTWAFSGDVFGVPAGTAASTSFISKYRGNDRIMGSMTYVF